ncbi:response regulator [Methyloceanibacter sp.]|uniref:response regulator n=1 Tax=Methyloceanibacter sp. TaxID=1965321 RepID=UPI00351AD6FE
MQPEVFRPDDPFRQIQGLVDKLDAERQAREAAEAADRANSELIATIGRELRTPLEAVIALGELLRASPLDPTQQHYTETLQHSARSLLGVIDAVIDFSKLDAGRLELQPTPFDLHELVQGVALTLQARANEKGLTSGVDIGANCPGFVVGDPARIRQVLNALIDNALRLTEEGVVRLYASANEGDGRIVLRFDVTDTSNGLDKDARAALFQPAAAQTNGTAADQPAENVLALSIARKLVGLMGGEMGCESAVGKGSLYWVTVPVDPARLASAPQGLAKETPQPPLSGHVLVVEDNSVNRMLIAAYLEEFGLTHDMVGTGGAAILALAEKQYDVVLMDTAMRDLDGMETTKRIRALSGPSASVPIVAVVANSMKSYCGNYLSAGMDTYVLKPIRGRGLYAALAAFLPPSQASEPATLAS